MTYQTATAAIIAAAALSRETGLRFLGHKRAPGAYIVAQVI